MKTLILRNRNHFGGGGGNVLSVFLTSCLQKETPLVRKDVRLYQPYKGTALETCSHLIVGILIVDLFYLFRPYHTLLFLVDEVYLVRSLPGDCSPAVTRLVRMASPLKRYKLSSVVRGKELTPSFLPCLLMMFVTIILMEIQLID